MKKMEPGFMAQENNSLQHKTLPPPNPQFLNRIIKGFKKYIKKIIIFILPGVLLGKCLGINQLIIITGQACTLKCRKCANFSPYLSKKYSFYNYTDIIKDLETITKKIRIRKKIQIQGGEFFIHPNAFEIIQYVKNNSSIPKIQIATNGTVVPSEKLLKEIHGSGIEIRISNYPPPPVDHPFFPLFANVKKVKEKLDEFNIPYYVYNFVGKKGYWYDPGDPGMQKLNYDSMLEYFNKCQKRGCTTLENGFVSICSRSVMSHIVQGFAITKDDIIDIRNSFSAKALIKFVNKHREKPISACYYCRGDYGEIPAAEQMTADEIRNLKTV
jgi:hypothetical protein